MRSIQEILSKTKYKETELENFLMDCYLDFLYFAEHVCGFDIADYHKEWFDLAETFSRLNIIAYRGSGKTCFFACAYYIWKAIFSKKDLNFLIVSSSFENSKLVLKLIRQAIMNNELLKSFVPEGKEATWRATELSLKTGSTFYCRTYGEGVRMLRIDYCLCDEAGLYEDKLIFWTAITPVVQLNRGKMIVIGTKKSNADLLCELEENEEYMSKEYPVIVDNKPLWPQKYTMLEHDTVTQRSIPQIRREMGELKFNQEYLLIPISSANSLLPYELTLPCCSSEEKFLPYGKMGESYYIGYDYAISPVGDWVVMSVFSVNADRKKLVQGERFRGTPQQQKDKLEVLRNNFKPIKMSMDATGLGEDQAKSLQKEFPELEAVKMTYDEKMKMILDLRQEFFKKNIVLPNSRDDLMAYNLTQQFLKEGNDFTLQTDLRLGQTVRPKFHSGKYDDCVISFALANKASTNPFGSISIASADPDD